MSKKANKQPKLVYRLIKDNNRTYAGIKTYELIVYQKSPYADKDYHTTGAYSEILTFHFQKSRSDDGGWFRAYGFKVEFDMREMETARKFLNGLDCDGFGASVKAVFRHLRKKGVKQVKYYEQHSDDGTYRSYWVPKHLFDNADLWVKAIENGLTVEK